jgi:hypothetical protein
MFRLLYLFAAITVALPASAQIDPVVVGQGAVNSSTMRAHANRIAGRSSGGSRAEMRAQARWTCAQREAVRARAGADDPRVRQIFDLCSRLGYPPVGSEGAPR